VLGVFGADWVEPLALVLQRLGSRHVLVVHAEDGLDEFSVGAPTQVAECAMTRCAPTASNRNSSACNAVTSVV